ncbi:MAG: hypothetical protein ACRD0D_08670 [Acidimicrobiales bacterium]
MAAIPDDAIRRLAAFEANDTLVVSLYLDVDGRRWPRYADCEARAERLVRSTLERNPVAADDLRRAEAFVRGGIDRARTRGLAIFSASGEGLWRVFELAVPVRDQIAVDRVPHVRQLETVLEDNERFGVLVADRQRARMFVFELGELVDKSELFDRLPRHDDDGGEWGRDHVRDHAAAAAHHHLRRAAQVAFDVYQERPFRHLVLAAPDDIANGLERELHSYLRDRIAARLAVAPSAREEEIREAALEVEAGIVRAREAELVRRLRDAIGSRNGGVAGLDRVLGALVERRVATLMVSDGYEAAGWRCPACRHLAARGRACPICSQPMELVDDVVERAIEEALNQSCRVAVCVGSADLDVLGRIGALLRF